LPDYTMRNQHKTQQRIRYIAKERIEQIKTEFGINNQ
jgi:hypothetical protein